MLLMGKLDTWLCGSKGAKCKNGFIGLKAEMDV